MLWVIGFLLAAVLAVAAVIAGALNPLGLVGAAVLVLLAISIGRDEVRART